MDPPPHPPQKIFGPLPLTEKFPWPRMKYTYTFVNLTLYSCLFILELSANDMEVWVFDTKRNAQVLKGRLEQEQHARRKEESMMDLELDFLAPYLQRIPDISSMTRGQALEVSIWKRIGSIVIQKSRK